MTAKFQIVPRPIEAGRIVAGDAHAAQQRDRYRGELENELGIAPTARRERLPRVQSSVDMGTVIATFFLALVAFATIFAGMLWREGRLPRLWPEPKIEWKPLTPKTDWMLSGEKTAPVKTRVKATAAAPAVQEEPAPDISVTDLSRPPPPDDDGSASENAQ